MRTKSMNGAAQFLCFLGMVSSVSCTPAAAPSVQKTIAPKAAEPAKKPQIKDAPEDGVVAGGRLLAPMPIAVTSFGAAVVGEHAYALGGYFGVPHEYSHEGQSRSLWRMPLTKGGRWQQVGEMPHGLQGLALVAHGDEVCRVGGNRILNAAGEPARMLSVAEVACFNTAALSWRELPSLPAGRSSHEATVIGDVMYVAGGWQLGKGDTGGTSKGARWHDDVMTLSLSEPNAQWKSLTAPFKRRAVGVAHAGQHLVVIGGLDKNRKMSKSMDVLDPKTGQWSQGPAFPSDAFGIAAASVGEHVYASAREGVVYRWRVGDDAWSRVGQLAFPRFFHQLLVSDSGLLALGGIGGMHKSGRTRHVERLSLTETSAGTQGTLADWTMPYPGKAKNRQAVFLNGDDLFLFGGNNSLGQHDFEPENFLAEGWRLHLPSMKWKQVAAYPRNRQTMQTVSFAEHGLAVGGFGHNGKAAVSQLESFLYDFDNNSWTPGPQLPRGRTQFGLAPHGDKLWVFGGLNYDPARGGKKSFQHVTNTLVADMPAAAKKSSEKDAPNMPLAKDAAASFGEANVKLPATRRAFAGAVLGDDYFIVGGMREGFQLVDGCLRYNFVKKSFAEFTCPSVNRLSAQLLAIDGKLFVVGGSARVDGKMKPVRSIEVYDPKVGKWSTLVDDVGFDTKHMRALSYRGRLLLASTHNDKSNIRLSLVTLQ